MGNTADKSYSCDTLAKEITFTRYNSGSDKSSSDDSAPNSYDRAYNAPPATRGSIRRRKDLRNSARRSKRLNSDNNTVDKKTFNLADMEVACDGQMCRLVPRDSAKRRVKNKRTPKPAARNINSRAPLPQVALLKAEAAESSPPLPPKTRASKPPTKPIRATELPFDIQLRLKNQREEEKIEEISPPLLPPKSQKNIESRLPVIDRSTKPEKKLPTNENLPNKTPVAVSPNNRLAPNTPGRTALNNSPQNQSNSRVIPTTPISQNYRNKSSSTNNINMNCNNNKLHDLYTPKLSPMWDVDAKLMLSQESILPAHKSRCLSSTPDITKLDHRFNGLRLVSPISDV